MTGVRLPKQPYRCYNCQRKRSTSLTGSSSSSATASSACDSSLASISSMSSLSSSPPSAAESMKPPTRPSCSTMNALPGVARQPASAIQYCRKSSSKLEKPYRFTCTSSSHYPVPHYATLPSFLPHQDHACPPCQLERLREENIQEACVSACAQYPSLKAEQLVKNGRPQTEWEGKMTLERYVEEKRQEEREFWLHLTRRWIQDLCKAKILVAEEDGLGLLT